MLRLTKSLACIIQSAYSNSDEVCHNKKHLIDQTNNPYLDFLLLFCRTFQLLLSVFFLLASLAKSSLGS